MDLLKFSVTMRQYIRMHPRLNLITGRNTILYSITWAGRLWPVVHAVWQRKIPRLTSQTSSPRCYRYQGGKYCWTFHWLNRWTSSELIDWEHWRSRVSSRGTTYVAKVTTTRGPGQWVSNDECVIDRLRVKSWINLMKQDWGDQINTTMNGRGHLVLIWG